MNVPFSPFASPRIQVAERAGLVARPMVVRVISDHVERGALRADLVSRAEDWTRCKSDMSLFRGVRPPFRGSCGRYRRECSMPARRIGWSLLGERRYTVAVVLPLSSVQVTILSGAIASKGNRLRTNLDRL